MIKVVLKNGYYYKGYIIEETDSKIIIRDIKNKIVEINKEEISVKEVEDESK